jgi:3-phosphoshikimate 1-carboxyvinyltransferase
LKEIVSPSKLNGVISPPGSKSVSHRALILGGFSKGTLIHNLLESADVQATKSAMEQMGVEFQEENGELRVVSIANHAPGQVNCHNSGTTLRLLTGIASLFNGSSILSGDKSLNRRPVGPLVSSLQQLGAEISTEQGRPPVHINGPVSEGELQCTILGNESSQYISALLLLAALRYGEKTRIELIPPVVSFPYIKLTLEMLEQADIEIFEENNIFEITGKQLNLKEINVPADFSSAAFFIVAGALPGNEITIRNMDRQYTQADSRIIDFVQRAGAMVEDRGATIHIKGDELRSFEADLGDCPDLFPILCVLAAMCNGTSRLYNAHHLKIKETDRISAMADNLKRVGIEINTTEDGAIITGGTINGGVTLDSFTDHRIAMACAILGTQATESLEIENAECVSVSYLDFFSDLRSLIAR